MTLPLLLSVPHGGLAVPAELAARCLLTPEQVAADGDVGAAAIYALGDRVAHHVATDVARAVLDMNRPESDRRRDGVVKTHTCWDEPVWSAPLDEADVERLLAAHHRPYHARLAVRDDAVLLGVDGHTMAERGPPVGPDPGRTRPAACLSDGGGTTCPPGWFAALAEELERALERPVARNDPFSGGWITRSHAAERPWVQLELSRAPYLPEEEKRARVLDALTAWCRRARPDGTAS